MKETPRRRIPLTSFLDKISTDQLGNRVVVRGEVFFCMSPPLSTEGIKGLIMEVKYVYGVKL
jgi:hypothetical protein